MQKIKGSRKYSFLVIAGIYVAAMIGALLIYPILPTPWWISLLIVDTFATVFVFLFSLIFENASVYDPYWSVQPIVIVLAFAVGKPLSLLRALLIIAVLLWGTRLTANWAYTFYGLNHQDWRYTMLKEKTGKTPVEYLNGYRIEKASQLLLNSDQSVTEIAFSCGFNDLSYFIKTFKKLIYYNPL